MMDNQQRTRPVVLVILVLLSVAGIILNEARQLQSVENVTLQITTPVQKRLNQLMQRGTNLVTTIREWRDLHRKYENLQDLADRLMIENIQLREAEIQNVELREQLKFKQANPSYEQISAEVIGQDANHLLNYLVIDRGAEDGLEIGMPVVTAGWLVGRITEVGKNWSRVLLITDASSSVNAIVQNSRATGLVQGEIGGGLIMRYIRQDQNVSIGDMVLTSGLGGNFPKRLVIGQVTEVRQRDIETFQEAVVRSPINFSGLETVLVIKGFKPVNYEIE